MRNKKLPAHSVEEHLPPEHPLSTNPARVLPAQQMSIPATDPMPIDTLEYGSKRPGRAILYMTPHLVTEVCKMLQQPSTIRAYIVREGALPADAKVVYLFHAPERDAVAVVLESSAWDAVEEGEEMPVLPSPVVEAHRHPWT